MKKNILFRRVLAVVSVIALAAFVMVGCQKEEIEPNNPNDTTIPNDTTTPVDPDDPTEPNHFYYGQNTLTVNKVIKMNMQGMIAYEFILNNNYIFTIMGATDIDSNGTNFTDVMSFFMTGQGTFGVIGTNEEDDEGDYVASGNIKITKRNNNYEIICKAITEANDTIDVYYNGPIFDMNNPTGTGSITVSGTDYALQVGIMGVMDGMYNYEFFDTQMLNSLDFVSKNALGNGTYTITDDDAAVAAGNGIDIGFDIINPITEDEIEGELTDGSLTCSISGDTYTISFSGNSNLGTVSGTYTGTITEFQMDKAAMKNANTIRAKMRK